MDHSWNSKFFFDSLDGCQENGERCQTKGCAEKGDDQAKEDSLGKESVAQKGGRYKSQKDSFHQEERFSQDQERFHEKDHQSCFCFCQDSQAVKIVIFSFACCPFAVTRGYRSVSFSDALDTNNTSIYFYRFVIQITIVCTCRLGTVANDSLRYANARVPMMTLHWLSRNRGSLSI